MPQLGNLSTEQVNQRSRNIDVFNTKEILELINEEETYFCFSGESNLPEKGRLIKRSRRIAYFASKNACCTQNAHTVFSQKSCDKRE